MRKAAIRLFIVWLTAAAILIAGCSRSRGIRDYSSDSSEESLDSSGELPETTDAASDQNNEETLRTQATNTNRLLMAKTTYNSSGTVLMDQYFGYDSLGWQKFMITTEPILDLPGLVQLSLWEYEDDQTKQYYYVFFSDGSVGISVQYTDSQGILKRTQSFSVDQWSDDDIPVFELSMQEDILFEWDAETRTASGNSSSTYRTEKYDENGQRIESSSKYLSSNDNTTEIVNTYDGEGNLLKTFIYNNDELVSESSCEYQETEDQTLATCVTKSNGETSTSDAIFSYYVPDSSWEEVISSTYGNLLGTWKSQTRDCYLILTAGDLFALVCYNEDGVPIPFEYGFFSISSPEDIRTDLVCQFTRTAVKDYEPEDDVDISLNGDTLTFGDEVFLKQSD